ncbi:sarcosine oxidase subunit gamma [Rhodopseudomonas telluris]|uniref:Sarcosine oxidase subunit gamma n=1 Tax=Rhodopseudomonas telluris TaxID=644215 RepID=A0ABV6EMP4_9BRAD
MAELMYQSPWRAFAPRGSGAGVIATPIERRGIAAVMARKGRFADLAARVQVDYGVTLQDAPKRVSGERVAFIGVGPGKWLAVSQRTEPGFLAVLAAQLDGLASVVEQSDGLAVLHLSGPALPSLLEKGFQIDCAALGDDGAAVTSVHHVGVTIWATGDGDVAIAVARSLVGGLLHWLDASAAIYGLAVVPERG